MKLSKTIPLLAILAATLLSFNTSIAEEAQPFEDQLKAIMDSVEAQFEAQPEGELPDLSHSFKALDTLAASEAATNPENAASALSRKAIIQLFYLEDTPSATVTFKELLSRFPGTPACAQAETMLAALKIQDELTPGTPFPDFETADLSGAPLSIANYSGKVILVDFWATWCPPCRAELPNVKAAYEQFHDQGFEIIGISLDNKQPTLEKFIDQHNMPWPQACDGKAWQGDLVKQYGVLSIPTTFLLDQDGNIVAKNLHGTELADHLAKLLPAE